MNKNTQTLYMNRHNKDQPELSTYRFRYFYFLQLISYNVSGSGWSTGNIMSWPRKRIELNQDRRKPSHFCHSISVFSSLLDASCLRADFLFPMHCFLISSFFTFFFVWFESLGVLTSWLLLTLSSLSYLTLSSDLALYLYPTLFHIHSLISF